MIQRTLPVGAFQCNCQILICPKTHEAVVVDPGEEPSRILAEISEIEKNLGRSISVKALLHTHAHFDHVGGTRKVKEALSSGNGTPPEIFLHRADEMIYQRLPEQGGRFGFKLEPPLPVDRFFEDEMILTFGALKITVLHTPGHSPGGVCFRLHEDSGHSIPETIFTGDTLFREDIGRADLWGGDETILLKSIRNRILTLDDDTCAWPGHGPKSTVGHERRANPYL